MSNEIKDKKIIIIDDEKSFCELLSFAFEKENFEVKCYTDPQEALLGIISDKPDVILLDILMPKLNGFSVLEYLKKDLTGHKYKIIIVTNLRYTDNGQPIDEKLAESLGVDALIYKTSDLTEIVEKIKKLIAS